MPETIRELYDSIVKEGREQGLSGPQRMYAVGWIFYDLFERASHDEKKGIVVTAEHFDRYAAELPVSKIARDVEEAQEEFGRVAAEFMDEEIQNRVRYSVDNSILKEIKSFTGSFKSFCLNVTAGVVAGFVFAALLFFCARIYEKDASPKQIVDTILNSDQPRHATNPPAALPPSPAPSK
jgi:hypothetical protein